jgi:RHS repeat-associated protein
VTTATYITTTDYAGNYIYQNNALQMINQPEGYLEPNGQGAYDYGYRLKDHLGSIRLTFVDFDHNGSIALSEITEENNYYPFGLKHQNYNDDYSSNRNAVAAKFKYNGKELNDELGLDWYDYGARFYDASLGRFHTIDPLAEKFPWQSTYVYADNNPIRYIDVNGMAGGDPPYMYATEGAAINGKAIYNAFNNLPQDAKRTINGAVKIVFGLAQFLGGAVFATVSSPTVVGGIAGGATAMHGAYKVGKGIHQLANVISGTDADADPKYNTPEGAITESKVVDNVVDLATGLITASSGNNILTTINTVSTINSSASVVIETLSNQTQHNTEEGDTEKQVDDEEISPVDDGVVHK